MLFTLETLRSRHGDCLLLHYGSRQNPKLALIDGGPSRVYTQFLRRRLTDIRQAHGLASNQSLDIDLVMVSHVDDDHICGILDLTQSLIEEETAHRPLPFKIRKVWHNTFDDIIGNTPGDLQASIVAQFGAASFNGTFPTRHVESGVLNHDQGKILASVRQGHTLRNDLRRLRIPLNGPFDNLVLAKGRRGSTSNEGGGLKLKVIGPMRKELLDLQKKHDAYLRANNLGRRDAAAALAAFSDKSVPNLASIVVLAQSSNKKILLTGDARGDKILEGMENAGLISHSGSLKVDVLKVPHHGSDNNVTKQFFTRVKADHYVFCGDGEYGNPERSTMEMLFDAKGQRHIHIYLTYPVDEIDSIRKQDREDKGKQWTASRHSLASFFRGRRTAGVSFTLHELQAGQTFQIDLRDRLTF